MTSCHDHGNCELCDWQEARLARLEGALATHECRHLGAPWCGLHEKYHGELCAALEGQPRNVDDAEWQRVHGAAAQAARDVAHWRTRAENAEARFAQLEGRDE